MWSEAPAEWRALFALGIVLALLVLSLLVAVILEAAQSTPLPEGGLKRDQATRERQRWLRRVQRHQTSGFSHSDER